MQSNQPYFFQKPMIPLADQEGYYTRNPHVAPFLNGHQFDNVDIQPSHACPRNFIIFDQSNNQSHVMFHPEINSKLLCTGLGVHAPMFQNEQMANVDRKVVSSFKEDSADIDALLSTEFTGSEDYHYDDDVVSTARTNGCNYSPDSCSSYMSSSSKSRTFFNKSYASGRDDKKRHSVRKIVKVLRGIVPGSNRMSSVAVLDEAVRHLKSLRVEVQKLGVGSVKI